MSSGVSRTRASKKNHSTSCSWSGGPRKGTSHNVTPDVNVGSGNDPQPSDQYVWEAGDVQSWTPPPPSNEHPSRGEHGSRSKTTHRNDRNKK